MCAAHQCIIKINKNKNKINSRNHEFLRKKNKMAGERVQGRDLVIGHLHRARILAWVLKKGVCTLAPNEYRTRAPYPGTKCELCLRYQFSSSLILLQYSDEKYDYSLTKISLLLCS